MSIEEIFSAISSHMIEGIMTHEQLMQSYLFLGLNGYATCHEYHYLSETKGYIKFQQYYLEHYGMLIKAPLSRLPEIIPETWYSFTRDHVEPGTRKQAMLAAYNEWINWEESTKKLYDDCYKDLIEIGEIAASDFLREYIVDVEEEIVYAKNERLAKSSMDFDIVSILEEQEEYERSFKKKIRKG